MLFTSMQFTQLLLNDLFTIQQSLDEGYFHERHLKEKRYMVEHLLQSIIHSGGYILEYDSVTTAPAGKR